MVLDCCGIRGGGGRGGTGPPRLVLGVKILGNFMFFGQIHMFWAILPTQIPVSFLFPFFWKATEK